MYYTVETADDIFKRKSLRYREDILDNMGSEELAANEFRITQAEAKLKRDNIKGEKNAKDVHYEIGQKVRKAIANMGGTMPEELPTPKKSLKEPFVKGFLIILPILLSIIVVSILILKNIYLYS